MGKDFVFMRVPQYSAAVRTRRGWRQLHGSEVRYRREHEISARQNVYQIRADRGRPGVVGDGVRVQEVIDCERQAQVRYPRQVGQVTGRCSISVRIGTDPVGGTVSAAILA